MHICTLNTVFASRAEQVLPAALVLLVERGVHTHGQPSRFASRAEHRAEEFDPHKADVAVVQMGIVDALER